MAATALLDHPQSSLKHPRSVRLANPVQFFSSILNSSTFGFAICDRRMRFRAINRALAAINGFPPEEHIGKSIGEILGSAAAPVESAHERVFSTGEPVIGLTIHAKLPTRKEMGHWIADYYPIEDSRGRVQQTCAIVVEVTAQQALRDLLSMLTGRLFTFDAAGSSEIVNQLYTILRRKLQARGANRVTEAIAQLGELPGARRNGNATDGTGRYRSFNSAQLSFREREVTRLIAEGWSNKDIAAALSISPRTVETHRANIMSKLGLHNVVDLVWYAIREGITEMPVHVFHGRGTSQPPSNGHEPH